MIPACISLLNIIPSSVAAILVLSFNLSLETLSFAKTKNISAERLAAS